MEEFIVWVIEEQRFFKPSSFSFGNEITKPLVKIAGLPSLILGEECEVFKYLGKKDISGSKIYIECSIIKVYDEKSKFYNDICKVIYCKFTCSYYLKSIDFEDEYRERIKADYLNKYYEVLDTLQENKLGLLEKENNE